MNKKYTALLLNILIWAIILIGINGAYVLASSELKTGHVCPTIVSIPACYIILSCLLLIAVSMTKILKDNYLLYYIGSGIAISIALFATIADVSGWIECPKTSGGTPMCYMSLALFASLIILIIIKRDRYSN